MEKNVYLLIALMSFCLSGKSATADSSKLNGDDRTETTKNANVAKADTESNFKWEFYLAQKDPKPTDLANTTSYHRLGKKVAYLYESFKDAYIVKEEVVPGDPTRRTMIRKPDIYNAVRTVEKDLNSSVKKKELTTEKAEDEFVQVLKVAIAAIDSDTSSFEEALEDSKKDASQLMAVFQKVNLKGIY